MSKRVLLVGAGAVGQVYGLHLSRSGHQVSFFVREKYRAEMQAGVVLHSLNQDRHRRSPIRFRDYGVVTSWDEAAATPWDMVVLCISSEALHNGFDLSGLAGMLGKATLVVLQPGPRDLALITRHVPAGQCVQGMITLLSYHTPMPGETTDVPGTAYWLPPLSPMPFSGPRDRRNDVIATFKSGGISAKGVESLEPGMLFGNAFFMLFLEALESRGWSLTALRRDTALLREMVQATGEAFSGIAAEYRQSTPLALKLVAPWMLKVALRIAPMALPLDIERFLEVHFTKVKAQTRMFVSQYIEDTRKHGLPVSRMEALHASV
jgi:ketopantoate reductase